MTETDNVYGQTLKPFHKNASEVSNIGPWGHTLRPHEGEWDLIGLESCPAESAFVGLVGCVAGPKEKDLPEIMFRQFIFGNLNLDKYDRLLNYTHGQGLVAVAEGRCNEVEEAILNRLESYGYIKKSAEGYSPTFLVMRKERAGRMSPEILEHYRNLRKEAVEIATRHYRFCKEQIYREIPDFLKADEFQIDHACASIFSLRGAVLEEALKRGYLQKDENTDQRALGASLTI